MEKDFQRDAQEMMNDFSKSMYSSKRFLVGALIVLSCFSVFALIQTFREVTWLQDWPYVRGLDLDFFFGMAMIGWLYWFLIRRLLMVWDK